MYDQICYSQTYLKQVIARVDFFAPVVELENSPSQKLTALISNDFPINEPIDIVSTSVQFAQGAQPQHQEVKHKLWNFFGKNREKQLTLNSSSAFVIYNKYTKYEDLRAVFASVLSSLGSEYKDVMVGRFGLRYVNAIEGLKLKTPTSWGKYINKKLLGTISFFAGEREKNLTRLFHAADMKYDEMNIKFQFGMPNPDFPAIMKRPMFVIDIDAYVDTAHKLSDVAAYMDIAHERVQSLFEDSITDELRGKMNATKSVVTI